LIYDEQAVGCDKSHILQPVFHKKREMIYFDYFKIIMSDYLLGRKKIFLQI